MQDDLEPILSPVPIKISIPATIVDLDSSPARETGGVNVLDFTRNPELDRLRRERCEQNFLKLQKALKR